MITLRSIRFRSENQPGRHLPLQPRRAPSSLRGHRRSRSSRVCHPKIITGQEHGRLSMVPDRRDRIPGRHFSIWRVRGQRVRRATRVRRLMSRQGSWMVWYCSISRRREIRSRGLRRAIARPSRNGDLGVPSSWLCFVTHPMSTALSLTTRSFKLYLHPAIFFCGVYLRSCLGLFLLVPVLITVLLTLPLLFLAGFYYVFYDLLGIG